MMIIKNPIAIISVILFLLVGCHSSLETKTFYEFYERDLENVTKIAIVDGSTGYKKKIEDQIAINNFLTDIKDVNFIPEENQDDRVRWLYSISLFENEEKTFQFGLGEVNGHYYYTEPNIFPIVDRFYKTVDVQEE